LLAHFSQRVVGVHADAEAHAEHAFFARWQPGESRSCITPRQSASALRRHAIPCRG
jgi:hypothetical protein